jgi:hypothetical protein
MTASWRRVRQFGRALTSRVRPQEQALVASLLPEAAARLFARMPRSDQRHSLDVLYALQEHGESAPQLLAAALLHDVAKGEGVHIWHRVLSVLLRALGPDWLNRVASPDPDSWRHPLWLQLRHPQRGAELAAAAGCAPATVELIRHHQQTNELRLQPPLDRWLSALQAADDRV